MAKVKKGTICSLSNIESEIHANSGFCKRCEYFNGVCSTDKNYISCLKL
jgi:hypothetical protein